MLLNKFIIFCFCCFLLAKNENDIKIKKASKLMQEAIILLKEVEANLQEQELLDPANYAKALSYIEEGKFSLAKPIFIAFSKIDDEKGYQSFYWLGVCFLAEKNYERAMISFTSFLHKITDIEISSYTTDMKKMAYKYLAKCYERLYRPIDACAIIDKLEKEFSQESDYAIREREHLKCDKYVANAVKKETEVIES